MSSHLLLPSLSLFFLFFIFFLPLTRPHEAEEWQSLPISTAISAGIGHIDLFRPYRHVSVAVSTVSVLVSTGIGVNRPHFGPNWHESGRVWVNQKKKKGGESRQVGCWTLRRAASDSGAATLELRRCFLGVDNNIVSLEKFNAS